MITILLITATAALACIENLACVEIPKADANFLLSIGLFEFICEGFGIWVWARKSK